MTIFTAPVGYGVSYAPAQVQLGKKVNPHKDSVFIDPQTGELTTIKPGLVVPEEDKKKGNGGLVALGATAVAAALAFVFRGKIKNIPFVKNTVIPAVKNGWTAVKNATKGVSTKVVDVAKNVWKAVKTYAGKAANAVKNLFKKAPAGATTP